MKICFVISCLFEGKFYTEIAIKLSELGFNIIFVTDLKEFAIDSSKNRFNVVYAPDHFEKHDKSTINEEIVNNIENKYGQPTLRSIYSSSQDFVQNLVNKSKNWWIIETIKYIRFWEDIIKEEKIECIITELGGERIRRVATTVAEKSGIHTLWISSGPIPNTFFLIRNEMGIIDEIKETFNGVIANNNVEEATKLINDFRLRSRMMVYIPPPKLNCDNLRAFFALFKTDIFIEKGKNPNFKFTTTTWNYLVRYGRSKIVQKYYEKPKQGEKFVFLPLHSPIDMQLTTRAPQYLDQSYVIKQCHEALPAGYKLYIKEHHASIGGYGTGFIKWISGLEDVRLISPYFNSHDLIKNASAIVVVNSTVGWEGILYNKPVVVLGHPFYRGFGITYDVDNPYDLRFKLMEALHGRIDDATAKRFVYSVMNSLHSGTTIAFDKDLLRIALQENNISSVSGAIAECLVKETAVKGISNL